MKHKDLSKSKKIIISIIFLIDEFIFRLTTLSQVRMIKEIEGRC